MRKGHISETPTKANGYAAHDQHKGGQGNYSTASRSKSRRNDMDDTYNRALLWDALEARALVTGREEQGT